MNEPSTLWFGGSFNPIHHGHLICARAVAEARGFVKVVLVPTGNPPHKPADADIAPAEHRLAMCRLAVEGSNFFEVEELEVRRSGPSYTIDTVREFRRRGHSNISWLIGADMVKILPTWHQPDQLLAEAKMVLMARPGWEIDWNTLPATYQALETEVVPAPLIEMSASDLRRRVRAGLSIEYLTPRSVQEYIRQHKLYQ